MTDISKHLRRAAEAADRWSPSKVRAALAALQNDESSRSSDWDEDAGEAWARVVDSDGVVGLVASHIPLVIVRSDGAPSHTLEELGPQVISVRAIDAVELAAENDAVLLAFPDLGSALVEDRGLLDLTGFSAEALWFATV